MLLKQEKISIGVGVANDVTFASGVLGLSGVFSPAPVLTTCLSVEVHPLTSFAQGLAKQNTFEKQKQNRALTERQRKLTSLKS